MHIMHVNNSYIYYTYASYTNHTYIIDMQVIQIIIRDAPKKKKRENVGIFPKWGTPPPSPLFGNDMFFF